jgi:acetyl esterase/lipase
MTSFRPVPHPAEMAFMELAPHHLADPALWSPAPVRVLPNAESYLNLRYAIAAGWRPLRLDLHLPLNRQGPVPVVVYAHGGSFIGGVKEMGPWATLPERGIAVASIEYRLAGEAVWPEPIEDALAAIRWVRSNADQYGLDGGKIAGWGSSAGGYLMARAALASDHPLGRAIGADQEDSAALDALVLHYAPADFSTLLDDAWEPSSAGREVMTDVVSVLLGEPMAQWPDLLEKASVVRAVGRASHVPPLHVSHGDADHRVGLEQSNRLVTAWRDTGAEATLQVVPGADHADPVFSTTEIVDPAVSFLTEIWSRSQAQKPLSEVQSEKGSSPS